MRKNLLIFAVLVTTAALVAGSFALPAMAAESATPVTETAEQTGVSVVSEDVSLRGEYEKHFLMSDGSYQAVVYSEPVHELVDGAWVEITSTNQNARDSATTDNTKSNIIDNYVLQGGGVQNKSLDRLYIGNRSAGLTRAYIQFATMPTIPEGSTITSATMTLHLTSGTSTAANASAYMVTGGEWTSGTIQWSNMPAANVLLQGDISHNNVTGYTFSCLSAVQTWYNGDSTGQNANYGIMLRYKDETVDDYNAVYSADYTDANKRPAIAITYASSLTLDTIECSVTEGFTKTLSVTSDVHDQPISWYSSNPEIATVNNGVVTAIKAGQTIISATTPDGSYGSCVVYVALANGIYYVRNNTSGYYLSAENGGISAGTQIVQNTKVVPKEDGLWQLWRIQYLAKGTYTIRPLHKLDLVAGCTNIPFLMNIDAGDSYSATSIYTRWSINWNTNGYVFESDALDGNALYANSGSVDGDGVGIAPISNNATFRWTVEKTTVNSEVIFYTADTERAVENPRRGVSPGRTSALADINLTYSVSSGISIDQTVTWFAQDSSIATVNETTGAVTGVSVGTTTIHATARINGVAFSSNYTLVVSEIPISGSELPYEPGKWNGNDVSLYTNCYAYILDNQIDPVNNCFGYNCTDGSPKQQPGEFYNFNRSASDPLINTSGYESNTELLVTAVEKDFEMYNRLFGTSLVFAPIGQDEICPDGTYKVALFVKPSTLLVSADYHWYRQDPDGLWSHKRGPQEVKRVDDSFEENPITDPVVAAQTAGYTVVVGYFAVTPWNNMASITANAEAQIGIIDASVNLTPTVSQAQINRVQVGMSSEHVIAILGFAGKDIGDGAIIHEYANENGEIVFISYEIDSVGALVVSRIYNGADTSM